MCSVIIHKFTLILGLNLRIDVLTSVFVAALPIFTMQYWADGTYRQSDAKKKKSNFLDGTS